MIDAARDNPDIMIEMIEDAPCGILSTDAEGIIVYMNGTLAGWMGALQSTAWEGRRVTDMFTTPGRIFFETHVNPMLRIQGFVREISSELNPEEANPRPVLLNGVARRDESGEILRLDFFVFDARERQIYERELREARREADELAAIVRNSPNAILRVTSSGAVERWNAGAEKLMAAHGGVALGVDLEEAIPLTGRQNWFRDTVASATDRGEVVFEDSLPDGRFVEVTMSPIGARPAPGAEDHWSVVLRDVTARERAEAHLKTVVDETRHRLQNTISVIAGIARQSLDRDQSQVFTARLQALSKAHDALTRTDWTRARIGDVVSGTVTDVAGADRFDIDVPDIWLSPQQTTALTLALHEMSTNALKYGALSTPGGFVRLHHAWKDEVPGGRLTLSWEEIGGPVVTPPERQGFGTRLLTMVLKGELKAEVTMDFRPTGLRLDVDFVPG